MTAGLSNQRRAGVCLHLTSLPGARGIGELGAAAHGFLDWMTEYGLSVWQFLPCGPTGFGNSPYQPLSVFAGNPLLIDLDSLVDWDLLSRQEVMPRISFPENDVDYLQVTVTKSPLLSLAAQRFLASSDHGLRDAFEAFCETNGQIWLDAFASFVVLRANNHGDAWTKWIADDRSRNEAIERITREHSTECQQIKVIQFFFARQWAALRQGAHDRGILLFGDVPIYMALDCAEAWAQPELLALDDRFEPVELAGVPPDYFSSDGQLWGNPVYRWEVHAANGYAWWIARLRHALESADMVRLDHFRAFDEYWAIPAIAQTARDGRWRPGPGAALFDAVKKALGNAPFVAEDLGIITDSVIALRRAYSLPGMRVLQFMVDDPEFDADAIDEDCVCYTGTHDNDTTVGWFSGSKGRLSEHELESLRHTVIQNTEGDADNIHISLISLCFSTRSGLAIVPLQDYLGLDSSARLNTPGQPEGNWRWRVAESLLERRDLDYIGALAERYGRR